MGEGRGTRTTHEEGGFEEVLEIIAISELRFTHSNREFFKLFFLLIECDRHIWEYVFFRGGIHVRDIGKSVTLAPEFESKNIPSYAYLDVIKTIFFEIIENLQGGDIDTIKCGEIRFEIFTAHLLLGYNQYPASLLVFIIEL